MNYTPLQMPDPTRLTAPGEGLANAIMQARQLQQQQEAQRANILLRRDEMAAESKRAEANQALQRQQMGMQEQKFKAEQAQQRGEVQMAITKALDAGRPDLARLIAKNYGINLGEETVQPPPIERQVPNMAQEMGPQISPDDARKAAFIRSGLGSNTGLSGSQPGMTAPGNIDLTNRPNVQNDDGSVSTVRSMGFRDNNREVLVPTVSEDGRIMADDEAMEQYLKTGRHLGQFKTPGASNRYAQLLHEQQERAPQALQDAEAERLRFQAANSPTLGPGTLEEQPSRQTFAIDGSPYDPQQTRQAEAAARQRGVDITKQAFAGLDPRYSELAANMAAAGLPPEKVAPLIQAHIEKETARAVSSEEKQLNREVSVENNKRMAAAIGARGTADQPQKEAKSNLDAAKYFSDEYGKFQKEAGLPQDAKDYRQLKDAVKLAKTGNALAQRKAAFNLGRAINGPGVFTDADRRAILGNISGILGMAETEVQKLISGEMGDRERAVVLQAVELQLRQVESRIDAYDENARSRFGADSEFADMQGLFENRHRANMSQYGRGGDMTQGGSEILIGSKRAMDARNKSRSETLKNGGKSRMDRALEMLK